MFLSAIRNYSAWEFPGGPVVRTLDHQHMHC